MSTTTQRARALAASALLLAPLAQAKEIAFVACPIVRDTKTVPCWLSEYQGELYYLGIQTDVSAEFNPPSLGHEALVEGRIAADEPRICGGVVLKDLKVSIMPELADNCRTRLMSDDRYQLPFEPPRPPGPSKGRLAFTYEPPPPLPKPPFAAKSFEILYDFDATVGFKHPRMLTPIMNYAKHVDARRLVVTGYRGATRLSDGKLLAESDGIAERRAREVAELLKGAGLDEPTYEVKWQAAPQTGDFSRRRVTVQVEP